MNKESFEEVIKHSSESSDFDSLDSTFEAFYQNEVKHRKFRELEDYFSSLVSRYIGKESVELLAKQIDYVEQQIAINVNKFKRDRLARKTFRGVNIVYYWEPPSVIDVELYMCCIYEVKNSGSLKTDHYDGGEFEPISLGYLENHGYPINSDELHKKLVDQFIQVAIFSRCAKILKENRLDYVPFSTSLYYGRVDAELPSLSRPSILGSLFSKFLNRK